MTGNARAYISAQRRRNEVDIGYDHAAKSGYVPPRRAWLATGVRTPAGEPIWADENDWTKEKYKEMDARFCAAMRQYIADERLSAVMRKYVA